MEGLSAQVNLGLIAAQATDNGTTLTLSAGLDVVNPDYQRAPHPNQYDQATLGRVYPEWVGEFFSGDKSNLVLNPFAQADAEIRFHVAGDMDQLTGFAE